QPVTISVRGSDPQGISSIAVWWSTDSANWKTTAMLPASVDAADPDAANYSAVLPGLPTSTLVQFYIQATDGLRAVATYPAGGAQSRAMFQVEDGKPLLSQLHRLRLLMWPSDANRLHADTNVMSNDHLPLTLIYDDKQVFYDVGIHLQASERGRNDSSRVGF